MVKQSIDDIVTTSTEIAIRQFKLFGFSEEQISSLSASGRRDLRCELEKLSMLLDEKRTVSIKEINNSLHALKGLLMQMGNVELGSKIEEIDLEEKTVESIEKVRNTLFVSVKR